MFLNYFEIQSDDFVDGLFVSLSSYNLEYNEGRSKLSEFFVSASGYWNFARRGFRVSQVSRDD